jgi:hypothetical protein
MKMNPGLKKLIPYAIGGLLLTGYQLYSASGKFGVSEMIIVALTAVVAIGVILLINKIFTKND